LQLAPERQEKKILFFGQKLSAKVALFCEAVTLYTELIIIVLLF